MNRYPIATETIDLDLYHLACIFAASKNLAELAKNNQSFRFLPEVFEFSEASKKLISIAVTLRSFLDNRHKTVNESVGILCKDLTKGKSIPLTLREACNKIIHAHDIDFFYSTSEYNGLEWSVKLFGTYYGNNWEATLAIDKFINITHLNI